MVGMGTCNGPDNKHSFHEHNDKYGLMSVVYSGIAMETGTQYNYYSSIAHSM